MIKRPLTKVQSEKLLQKQIKKLLDDNGILMLNVPMHWPVSRYRVPIVPRGWPDFVFAVNGQAVAWECKQDCESSRFQLSEDQQKIAEWMKANGWKHEVVRTLEQADQLLAGYLTMQKEVH